MNEIVIKEDLLVSTLGIHRSTFIDLMELQRQSTGR